MLVAIDIANIVSEERIKHQIDKDDAADVTSLISQSRSAHVDAGRTLNLVLLHGTNLVSLAFDALNSSFLETSVHGSSKEAFDTLLVRA